MTPPPSANDSTVARAKGLLADVLELAQVRLELFTLEARLEASRITWLAITAALAVVFVSFGLIFFAVFVTVMLWETQRLLALGVFTALFLGIGAVLCFLALQRARQAARMFSATLDELRRDQERLRS